MQFDSQDDELTVFSALRGTAAWIGEVAVANPASVGAATAFCVAMTFFTANAVYFQDGPHPAALFATRPELVRFVPEGAVAPRAAEPVAKEPDTTRFALGNSSAESAAPARIPQSAPLPARRPETIAIDTTPEPRALGPDGDDSIAGIQELLAKLGYYDGAVDGLRGPQTDAAIETYKNNAGLRGIELTEAELVTSIRNNLDVTAAIPAPRPKTASQAPENATASTDVPAPVPAPELIPSAEIVKVQAALRAFGNTDIVVDGIAGDQTTAAIREFQSLFRLPVTGEIDGVLLDKMRAVGLIK